MAQISKNNSFLRFDLEEEEYNSGANLNGNTEMVIQNLLADAAEEKVALTFTEENKQREAELAGTIIAYKYLLELSRAMKENKAVDRSGNGPAQEGDPSGRSVFK